MSAGPHAALISTLMNRTDRPTARDWSNVLAHMPLFRRVSKRHLRQLGSLAQVREFERGEFVMRAGDPADGFYIVLAGGAKVTGRPRARTLRQGDYFGEMALLNNEPRSAGVVAIGDLHTMWIPRAPFMRLLKQEPSVAVAILAELADRLRRVESADAH